MEKNYFEILCEIISENEKMKKFKGLQKNKNEFSFVNGSQSYEIVYDESKKLILLNFVCGEKITELSSWFFDMESLTRKDINLIVEDFIETMSGKNKKYTKQSKKSAKSSDESNITGLFFANRMVNIFPDLKLEIQKEKDYYEKFRPASFACENILPKIQEFAENPSEKNKFIKLGKLLSDMYENGTLDVRSIITMGILNSISSERASQNLKEVLTPELNKAWDAALKYKGKKVNPEKSKSKKSLLSKALEMQQQSK